mmetsp:Transcript_12865/g.16803  ORF Transcript_12865/g.16803 Transcript_12865/m.16803 type:complete len:334 (-) Transcript_12865:89-1090(-)
MNTARFRSPLLQQLVRNAYSQRLGVAESTTSRAGLWASTNASASNHLNHGDEFGCPSDHNQNSPSTDYDTNSYRTGRNSTLRNLHSIRNKSNRNVSCNDRGLSTQPLQSNESDADKSQLLEENSLQEIIRTRRSIATFISHHEQGKETLEHIKLSTIRACECAMSAPNHKRTEPLKFKRMIAPSDSTRKLAEIAFEVANETKGVEVARAKRLKWLNIPAFLVVLVKGPIQHVHCDEGVDMFKPFPVIMPRTERQLEDYASSCAAVQNSMLSLHSEGIGSKWATGPIIRTPAFRHLVGVEDDEIVTALLMVGVPSKIPKEPRRRYKLNEILEDI